MNRSDPNRSEVDKNRAGEGGDRLPSRSWSIKKWTRHKLLWSSGDSLGRLALDLERKLLEARGANLIEHARDVAMERIAVSPDEDFCLRRGGVNLFQLRQNFLERDPGLIEVIIAVLVHRQADVILLRLRLARRSDGQIHFHALHRGLAQAHHH